jgi:hypothetical protein
LIRWKDNNEKSQEEDNSDYEVDSLVYNNQDIYLISDRLANKKS